MRVIDHLLIVERVGVAQQHGRPLSVLLTVTPDVLVFRRFVSIRVSHNDILPILFDSRPRDVEMFAMGWKEHEWDLVSAVRHQHLYTVVVIAEDVLQLFVVAEHLGPSAPLLLDDMAVQEVSQGF